jgi:hypothetical protein
MPDSGGARPSKQDLINSVHNVAGTDNVKTTICSLGYDAV